MARSASFAFLFTRVGLAGADMGSAYLLRGWWAWGGRRSSCLLGDKVDADAALAMDW